LVAFAVTAAIALAAAQAPAQAAKAPQKPTASPAPLASPDWAFNPGAATMADVAKAIRADSAHRQGYTGKGIGIAMIDTGVVPVQGLISGNVANGPDLSLESQVPSLVRKDTYGHGTHLAGIIAGRDSAAGGGFRGIAPDAKLTSIKVGMANGAVDVSQVMAAVDWVVAHRNDDPANPIRVLNLSYGTDSTLDWSTNPLTHAVQVAYRSGIVVVVAAGNTGAAGKITNPAFDPFSFTVGSTDTNGTTSPADDTLADFSSRSGNSRGADILAPGRSLVSLRNPGSYADAAFPSARVGDRYFKGSGTSQSAAVVSGAVALLLQKYPTARPDNVKCTLEDRSSTLIQTGSGLPAVKALDIGNAVSAGLSSCTAMLLISNGNGSLQATRGTSTVTFGPENTPLVGENDIFGPFSTTSWAAKSATKTSWQGGNWMGRPWTGTGWTTASGGQANWAGRAWSGRAWSGRAWSDLAWAQANWSGRAWSNTTTAHGVVWAGSTWSGVGWLGGSANQHWLL
jgi:serine protease AprX